MILDLETIADMPRPLKISCFNCLQKIDVTPLEAFSTFACPECGAELIVPQWFEEYLLEEEAGHGGMALVYRALDPALDREVAIKILHEEFAKNEEFAEMFLNEARTSANINHYAVVPIYSCGMRRERPYIVMQFMDGGSLDTVLRNKIPYNLDDAIRWIRQAAEGLESAWRHGIIHHDVKPGNIMLDTESNAKICDFGLAEAVNRTGSDKLNEMLESWASPEYVSPEKLLHGLEDYKGDIYSLGVTFYELAVGQLPFFHLSDRQETAEMRLKKNPPVPHKVNPEIPTHLSEFIMKMIARYPDGRPEYRDIIKFFRNFVRDRRRERSGASNRIRFTKKETPVNKNTIIIAVVISVVVATLLAVGIIVLLNSYMGD
jgi:serine/threonine protein kinase